MQDFERGDRVGDYAIDDLVARDEHVVTYTATHLVLPRRVQLQVVARAERPAAVQLLREACLLEALQHPGIPRVFECGVLADRRPWVATQHLDGEPLQAMLADEPAAVLALIRDVAEILVHAHARGVVHGRVSPETILRTPGRAVYLRGWTAARTVANAQMLEVREDVYALGEVAFRALTGCHHSPTVSATEWCPSAPPELTALIDVMLDGSPHVRPASDEVRERARWLLAAGDPLAIAKPRWTPPNGYAQEEVPPAFSIRIGRTVTRGR